MYLDRLDRVSRQLGGLLAYLSMSRQMQLLQLNVLKYAREHNKITMTNSMSRH